MTELKVPGDKSISHRALLLSALAGGESRIRGILTGEDPQATASILRELGVPVPRLVADRELRITGVGVRGLRTPRRILDCANSGTTARLMLGVLAGQELDATLTGDESLRRRPMRRVTDPLSRMGARFEPLAAPGRLPLRVTGGTLRPLDYRLPVASAQLKSALLLAGVTGGVPVRLMEPGFSRDHTERMLAAAGCALASSRRAAPTGCASPPRRPPWIPWTWSFRVISPPRPFRWRSRCWVGRAKGSCCGASGSTRHGRDFSPYWRG